MNEIGTNKWHIFGQFHSRDTLYLNYFERFLLNLWNLNSLIICDEIVQIKYLVELTYILILDFN